MWYSRVQYSEYSTARYRAMSMVQHKSEQRQWYSVVYCSKGGTVRKRAVSGFSAEHYIAMELSLVQITKRGSTLIVECYL